MDNNNYKLCLFGSPEIQNKYKSICNKYNISLNDFIKELLQKYKLSIIDLYNLYVIDDVAVIKNDDDFNIMSLESKILHIYLYPNYIDTSIEEHITYQIKNTNNIVLLYYNIFNEI